MDYNSYGYQYASSFSKNEDSNVQIPWYIWTCDVGENGKFYEMNNRMMRVNNFMTDDGVTIVFSMLSSAEKGNCDFTAIYDQGQKQTIITNRKIASKLQTKLFDFSSAGYLKNIDRVGVAFGNNGGEPITVSFVSNIGTDSEMVSLYDSDTDERDASFVSVKSFRPSTKSVRTFGVKVECDGQLIVDGLSIQYRLLGGVK